MSAGPAAQAGAAPDDEKTGGETTVFATGQNAFSFPFANLPDEERTRFVIGNSFFKRNWVQAPSSTTATESQAQPVRSAKSGWAKHRHTVCWVGGCGKPPLNRVKSHFARSSRS